MSWVFFCETHSRKSSSDLSFAAAHCANWVDAPSTPTPASPKRFFRFDACVSIVRSGPDDDFEAISSGPQRGYKKSMNCSANRPLKYRLWVRVR